MATPDFIAQTTVTRPSSHTKRSISSRSLHAHPSLGLIWASIDFFAATLAVLFAMRIHSPLPFLHPGVSLLFQLRDAVQNHSLEVFLLYPAYVVIFANFYGLYRAIEDKSALNEQRMTVQALATAGLMLCGTLFLARAIDASRTVVAVTMLGTMVLSMSARAVGRKLRERRFVLGLETRNVLIVGNGHVGHALRNHLIALSRRGFRFKGFVTLENSSNSREEDEEVIGDVRNCVPLARSLFVDEIYFSTPADRNTVVRVVEEARVLGIEVRVVPDLYDGLAWNAPVEYVGQFPTIPLHHGDFPRTAFVLKRTIDVAVSVCAMVILSPLLLALALVVKLSSSGPVFYRAERIGRKGRGFTCLKFRTMVQNADALRGSLAHLNERDGVLFKISNDPRLTRCGALLRKYSLDELPQFYNVLVGDMSLVGPRPPLAAEVEKYELTHLRRLDVLPGMTGLWQVEAREDPSFDSYISLDTAYVDNWNLMLDFRILAKTLSVVLGGTGR
jgi:exopolysaccharide biosynthesis polyprenyl glycosylphosphotransferase